VRAELFLPSLPPASASQRCVSTLFEEELSYEYRSRGGGESLLNTTTTERREKKKKKNQGGDLKPDR